jgi:hypothetical protein
MFNTFLTPYLLLSAVLYQSYVGTSGLQAALSVFAHVHYVILTQEKYFYEVFEISNALLI